MEVIFQHVPGSVREMTACPQWGLRTPWDTAALFIAALCVYRFNPEEACNMISALRGPAGELSGVDRQFLRDHMGQKAEYLGCAYLRGATPENNYMPAAPYTVILSDNGVSYDQENMARIFVHTAGADSPRPITMRLKPSEGRWYLYEWSSVLSDIRKPVAADPWA